VSVAAHEACVVTRLGAAHAPSPDVRSVRKPNRVSDGDLWCRAARGCPCPVAGRSLRQEAQSRQRWGSVVPRRSGLPMPRRWTFAPSGSPIASAMGICGAAPLGAAHAPTPDVRLGHPGLGSLGCRLRFAILAALVDIRRLPGHGQPLAASTRAHVEHMESTCLRPAAAPRRRARITRRPYQTATLLNFLFEGSSPAIPSAWKPSEISAPAAIVPFQSTFLIT